MVFFGEAFYHDKRRRIGKSRSTALFSDDEARWMAALAGMARECFMNISFFIRGPSISISTDVIFKHTLFSQASS